jgi:adenylate cyclase
VIGENVVFPRSLGIIIMTDKASLVEITPEQRALIPEIGDAPLRHELRRLLNQIICYGEIAAEEIGNTETSAINELKAIISEARSTLHFVNVLFTSSGVSLKNLQEEMIKSTETMAAVFQKTLATMATDRSDLQTVQTSIISLAELSSRIDTEAPATTPIQNVPTPLPQQAPVSPSVTPKSSQGLLLIVDDDEKNRDILSRRLKREGYSIVMAESGLQALNLAREHSFDLILLDIVMPEMNGLQVLEVLKNDPEMRHIPVIMISAVDEIQPVVRCIEMGAEDFLPKPFNPVLLRARIGAIFERKRLKDEEKRKNNELEAALLDIEKEKRAAEDMLCNILPQIVARELRASGSVDPMYFEDVTIVFTDFVGFTLSTETLAAEQLVEALHEFFTEYDRIIERYGLEKLKTIGDSYMFAGGLPVRSSSHPVDALLAAFELIEATKRLGRQNLKTNWRVRIGVHTGPVIAGVVGIRKFAFDIWGDSVNFSSRMESSGVPDRINISPATYTRVKDFFACEPRGKIKTKDKRKIDMYFVNGITPDLLVKSPGSVAAFERRYRIYFHRDLTAFPEFLLHAQGAKPDQPASTGPDNKRRVEEDTP